MNLLEMLESLSLQVLLLPTLIIMISGFIISFKLRFIQIRALGLMFKTFWKAIKPQKKDSSDTIQASKALFTAMSTTIGTSSIVSPAIAIKLGGPGALVGFLIATLLGGAVTFVEVTLALVYRKKLPDGSVMGGPMQYLKTIHPLFATIYAGAGMTLLAVWSSLQANTLSDLLTTYHIPGYATGIVLALTILFALMGGIKRIGNISEKLVPVMFFLYAGAALWIIGCNIGKLPSLIDLIFRSAFTPYTFSTGFVTGGLFSALRWGLFRGIQANEAGVGTTSIPHSMSDTTIPQQQGLLAMVAIYSHGFICLLSGLVTLITETWQDDTLSFGINIVTKAFSFYFSQLGPIIITFSAIMFAYGTILGNSYNGSQCFSYFSKQGYLKWYYLLISVLIFIGSVTEVKLLWIISDFFLIPVALPNIIGILILTFRDFSHLKSTKATAKQDN